MWPSCQKTFQPDSNNSQQAAPGPNKKLRSACNRCHQSKTKCTGGIPCASCAASKEPCYYSVSTRTGRPKGARNKRNHEQMSSKSQAEIDSAAEKASPVETKNGAFKLQYPASEPLTPPHAHIDQSLMQLDNMLSGGSSGHEFAQDTPFSINSNALCNLLDYNMGKNLQRHESMATKSPNEGSKPNSLSANFTTNAQETPFGLSDRSSYASSPGNLSGDGEIMPGGTITSSMIEGVMTGDNNSFAYPQLFTPPKSSMPSSLSSSSQAREIEHRLACNCLEQHTALLCRLKSLTQSQGMQSVDAILTGTQQALAPWQNLIDCPICPDEDDLSVLLVAVLSIRFIVRRLQALCYGSTSAASDYSTAIDPVSTVNEAGTGAYEPTQHERKHITDLLIIHAIGKIKFALLSLKNKFAQAWGQKAGINAQNAQSIDEGSQQTLADSQVDIECIQKMFESLESTI